MPTLPLALLTLLLLLSFSPLYAAGAAENVTGSIRVVMNSKYPPFSFLDDAGHLKGILVDEWRLWEQTTHRKVELDAMDWEQAQRRMDAGEFDVIDAIFLNELRARKYDFSEPYYRVEVPAFFNQSISGIESVDALRGFAVGVMAGDSVIAVLKRHGVTHLVEFDSYQSMVNAAKQGKVVVFVADQPPALYYLYQTGLYQQFKQSPPIDTGKLHRAVKKGNLELLATVESGFAQIPRSELDAIEKKWLGKAPYVPQTPKYLLPVAVGILGGLLLLGAWNFTLRRLVALRTSELTREVEISRETAEELHRSEEKFRLIFDNAPFGIFQSSVEGRILSVNPAQAAMFGYESPELMMRSVVDIPRQILVQPEQRSDLIRSAMAAGTFVRREVDYRRRNGTELVANLYLRVVQGEDGAVQFVEGFVEDITERKRAQERNLRLAEIVDSSDDAIIGKNLDGTITSWNKGAERILGYSEAEMIGQQITRLIPPEYRDEVRLVREKIERGEHLEHFETVRVRKDGERIFVSVTYSPVRDGEGRIVATSTIGRDITELKKAQSLLLETTRLNRELEIAQEIQQAFLPACPLQLQRLLTACCCLPAAHVGGDYYDFFTPGPGLVDLVIADITGHNVGAALLMTGTRSILHAKVRADRSPGRLLAAVNELLLDDLCRAELQISMFYARFDLENGTLSFANAGHNRPLFYRASEGCVEELDADGLLLGIMRGVHFEEKSIPVQSGDLLLMYTDGVTESENAQDVPFGCERLGRVVTAQSQHHPRQMVNAILQELAAFRGAKPHADDITMVAGKIT